MDTHRHSSSIERFRSRIRGVVVLPGDDEYDAARRVWNGMIDKKPAMIAYCTCSSDVMEAIGFAGVSIGNPESSGGSVSPFFPAPVLLENRTVSCVAAVYCTRSAWTP